MSTQDVMTTTPGEIPTKTTVLVIGGGPGGSYAASALARDGIDVVLLEADIFPRYHVGESMVASIRHFLRFIDLDETFNKHGFVKKTGAAFKLNNQKAAYTDFIVAGGPDVYAWNVVRSESDDLMFRHAGKCGAKIFDGVAVKSIEWDESDSTIAAPGRPVSATYKRKDGTTGEITFDYIVDASGRAGIVSTKYLKNRSFNADLKNVASWGYWKGAVQYGEGTPKEGQPFFEALADGSGWCWFIPLHNGTVSVGVVMNQNMSTEKKKAAEAASGSDFYVQSVKEARGITHLLSKAALSTEVKHAADWSYQASKYASPYVRIVGDAGCFIDPYFSSGIHLALSGALSAAVTICASIRGDCPEETCLNWHSQGVSERYTRFMLVVMSATKQIRAQDAPVLNQQGEDGFDDAFSIIRPVIQGIADVSGKATQTQVNQSNDFTYNALQRKAGDFHGTPKGPLGPDGKAFGLKEAGKGVWEAPTGDDLDKQEQKILKMIKNVFKDFFDADSFNGMVAKMDRGGLGLMKAEESAEVTTAAIGTDMFGAKK